MASIARWFIPVSIIGGGFGAAINYKFTYEAVPTDIKSTEEAVATFSVDSRRMFYDVAVVGGGIVGVATAREIRKQFPNMHVVLLEKEADVAQHQSSHNSGVVHAGMYYPEGSLMSKLCPRGHDLMIDYCKRNKLPYERVGKLIVAIKNSQIPSIENLYHQGIANGVRELKMLYGKEEIQKIEPNVFGVCALYSPDTAITDFSAVARHMFKELSANGRRFFDSWFRFEVLDFVGLSFGESDEKIADEMVLIRGREDSQLGPEKIVVAKNVITCCGLSNDLLARRSGNILGRVGSKVVQTFSFRGRYYQLKPEARDLVRMNVYPAPDKGKGISVGVHFTPTVDERRGKQIIIGPGSAVTTHRYGYSPYWFDIEYCWNSVTSKGGWVSFARNMGKVMQTFWIDVNRAAFLREAQKLVPSLQDSDIEESFCGVMGVAVTEKGTLEMDLAMEFARPRTIIDVVAQPDTRIEVVKENSKEKTTHDGDQKRALILNVRNAPSPAATSSMAIAEHIVAAAKENFGW